VSAEQPSVAEDRHSSSGRGVAVFLLLLAGIVALVIAINRAHDVYQLRSEMQPAVGVIGAIVRERDRGGRRLYTIYYHAVHYKDARGREHAGQIQAGEGRKPGDRIEILASRSNPALVIPASMADPSRAYTPAAIGAALLLAAAGLWRTLGA
jgi:hypothetical protein